MEMQIMAEYAGALSMAAERERSGTCLEHAHTLERLTSIEANGKHIKEDIDEVKKKVDDVLKLLHSRPSWFVCIIFSFLMTLCGILITIIETGKNVAP
jgi:hypothetical protein